MTMHKVAPLSAILFFVVLGATITEPGQLHSTAVGRTGYVEVS
jgi:hypothetical protein